MPSSVKRFMKTWRRCLPDYEIKVWTENEFDPMSSIPYVREAYECEKYAFVSDYVRLYALNEYGGIYLDTDVEVLKSFDTFLDGPFMCFESDEHLKAWLLKVTTNKCKNYKRSFRVSHTGTLEEDYQGSYNMDTTDVEVRELLSSLPPKYGAVMYLYLYESRTVEEIAALLDKKINTVKSLIRRGKAKLKIELADENQTTKQGSVRRT